MKTLRESIALYASAQGSEAKTSRGQLKAALAYRRGHRRAAVLPGLVELEKRTAFWLTFYARPADQQYLFNRLHFRVNVTCPSDKARTFTPEERAVRRAIHDKTFRTGWLRENTAAQKKLLRVGRHLADITKAIDLEPTTSARLKTLAEHRARVTGKPVAPAKQVFPGHTLPIAMATARKCGYHGSMVGKDWTITPTRGSSHLVEEAGHTVWDNGKPKDYVRATRDNYVRSFGVIRDPRTLDFAVHIQERTLVLPEGLSWGVDSNGLHVVDAQGDDYHPSAGELLLSTNPQYLLDKLATNRETRRRLKAEAAAQRAEIEGVWVCLADSLRGGNCRSGSEEWARRHQISPKQHLPALRLLEIAGKDSLERVRLAIAAATRRHRQEVAQDFCLLSEHQMPA